MDTSTDNTVAVKDGNKPEFNADEASLMLGLTPQQRKFADFLLLGCTQTEAAKRAGYSGEGNTLRATASTTAKSAKVRSYLAWAKSGGAGVPDDPADVLELKKTLSKHLRGSDKNASIRAAEILYRLDAAEKEAKAQNVPHPLETLDAFLKLGELGVVMGLLVARAHNLEWNPKIAVAADAEKRITEELRGQLTPAERSKADSIIELNTTRSASESGPERMRERQKAPPAGNTHDRPVTSVSSPAVGPNPHAVAFRNSKLGI